MTFTITRRQRALLLFLSASGFIAWFSGLGDRIEAQGAMQTPGTTLRTMEQARAPRVASLIVRDPFAGAPVAGDGHATAAAPVASPAHGGDGVRSRGSSERGGPSDVVVPNIDGGASEPAPATARTLMLRATIVGPNPVAYVANGTMMDIVRVGDTLADRRVTKIDLHGLVFADGTRLDLPDAFLATPRPRTAAAHAITLGVDDLRRLLAPPAAATAPSRPGDAATAAPQPSASPIYPTPGPLPSVNSGGIPVGVNPTSNPSNPTPYPYPYPYAPPGR